MNSVKWYIVRMESIAFSRFLNQVIFNDNIVADFYKNNFYKIIKEKFEFQLKNFNESADYNEQQRQQLSSILDTKNKELSKFTSECNRLKNVVEMQKTSLTQLEKDYQNALNSKAQGDYASVTNPVAQMTPSDKLDRVKYSQSKGVPSDSPNTNDKDTMYETYSKRYSTHQR